MITRTNTRASEPTARSAALAAVAFVVLALAACVTTARNERAERLDSLFAQLKAAPDEATARSYENEIWKLWLTSGNPELDRPMQTALEARRWGELDRALRILDDLVTRFPEHAEVWNQRATVHFHLRNYEQSLRDIAETLAREPRHFGALTGRGMIRLHQGDSALAIQNILEAMKIHPFVRERSLIQR